MLLKRSIVAKEVSMFFLCALPTLIWILIRMDPGLTDEWIQQLRARSSHHSFPFSWSKERYSENLLLFGLGILTWGSAFLNSLQDVNSTKYSADSINPNKDTHRKIGIFGLTVIFMCIIGENDE